MYRASAPGLSDHAPRVWVVTAVSSQPVVDSQSATARPRVGRSRCVLGFSLLWWRAARRQQVLTPYSIGFWHLPAKSAHSLQLRPRPLRPSTIDRFILDFEVRVYSARVGIGGSSPYRVGHRQLQASCAPKARTTKGPFSGKAVTATLPPHTHPRSTVEMKGWEHLYQ